MTQMTVDRYMRDHHIGEREGLYANIDRAYRAYTKHLLDGNCPCDEICTCPYTFPCPECGEEVRAVGEDMDLIYELKHCGMCEAGLSQERLEMRPYIEHEVRYGDFYNG